LQQARTGSAKGFVDRFEAPDEIENFPARIRPAGRGTKMRPATERT
jgi:hypothetical protein